ncbi:MAG: transcriptional regulator [Verrucomicrobiales bacterium]
MNFGDPIDFSSLDTAVHGPVRLGVLAALQAGGALDFTALKRRLKVADGAMGMHLQKLEAIGYVVCTKRFIGRRPNSSYELTEAGRAALFNYLGTMQRLIDSLVSPAPQPPNRQP